MTAPPCRVHPETRQEEIAHVRHLLWFFDLLPEDHGYKVMLRARLKRLRETEHNIEDW